jgi:hypothetical protein
VARADISICWTTVSLSFALASALGLMAAAGAASQLSPAVTFGRDAARLTGSHALAVPGWRSSTAARWGPEALDWGPLYEPHRYPAGATLGARLRLAAGEYVLSIEIDPSLPVQGSPELEVRPEAREAAVRVVELRPSHSGWTAGFDVRSGEQDGLRLALRGGPPFFLRTLVLDRSTFSPRSGPSS